MNSEMAYENGASLGARTADALAQAKARRDQNVANDNLDANLTPLIPDPAVRAAIVQGHRAGLAPEQIFNSLKTNQETGFNAQIANPDTSDDQTARLLMANGKPANIISSEGEGQVTNRLHPSAGVALTQIGQAIAGQKGAQTSNELAEAAKSRDQVANPGKYRILPTPGGAGGASDGSAPIADENTAQLVAAGLMQAPAPGSKAYMMLGGDGFSARVNYIAGQNKGVPAGGPAAAAPPPVAPGAQPLPAAVAPKAAPLSAPGTVPPAQPGATQTAAPAGAGPTDTSGIKLPPTASAAAAPGFQANFDGAAFAQHRTTLNDLSRKSGTGGNDDALNRVAGHLDVYEQLMQQSGNSSFRAGNQLMNWFKTETGKPWPGSAALAAQVLGTEIVRSMTTVGAGGVDERADLAKAFSNANSFEAAKGPIATSENLLREQAIATNQRVSQGGVKDYFTKYLTPTAQRRLRVGAGEQAPAAAAPAAAPGLPSQDAIAAELARRGIK